MRRAVLIASAIAFAPMIAILPSGSAYAGITSGVAIGITHSPSEFTVGEDGTFTVTLSSSGPSSFFDFEVVDTVPDSFSITSVDEGDYDCETDNGAHTVDCTFDGSITSESFTIHVTPSIVGGPFTDTASFSFQATQLDAHHKAHGSRPDVQGGTANDQVNVVAQQTESPTPRPTPTPTPTLSPTPTPTPTHTATHKPTPTPAPTVRATSTARSTPPSLPNTGGNDIAPLIAFGALLISAGGFVLAVATRRRA